MSLPSFLVKVLPEWKNSLLAIVSAILLVLAFPDFEWWFLAWIALVPLFCAIEREKDRPARGLFLGWIWGAVFFFGTCWWLTFAPITYAGFPWPLAYLLMLLVAGIVAIFPGLFGLILAVLINRFGRIAILSAPFVWVFTEFLRYWITGNNWNAIGYSHAFGVFFLETAGLAGALGISFICVLISTCYTFFFIGMKRMASWLAIVPLLLILIDQTAEIFSWDHSEPRSDSGVKVVAIQPNVPMSGLTYEKWKTLRQKHVQLAESAINDQRSTINDQPTTVIFPESPMNFAYDEDAEFRSFLSAFAAKNNVNVLFNSAEPNQKDGKYFNSAVLVDTHGQELAQYDKIYLLPFGESVPRPLQSIVPAFVGSFSYGTEYDLLPLGDAKAGVMICFESHFGELSREYVRNGADVLIEMTNDGYLGPTPVLRQHLANAVFRAVETNRPVLRVTNVGITAFI
ncbi:MAG TPA: apolipoprotein N-acyltransferase, partial [Pyrinomonadaceae bacterium]|nr:apolipoprotein N-acyltransferase [Pyrinomonadaceae bacterium]